MLTHPNGVEAATAIWGFSHQPVRELLSPDGQSVASAVLCSLRLDQTDSMSPVPTPETNSSSVMKLANGPDGLVA